MRIHEPRPDGTPSYQQPARPCAGCGTIWGGHSARMIRAVRIRGLCKRCYDREQKRRYREGPTMNRDAYAEPEPKPATFPAWVVPARPCVECKTVWGFTSGRGRSPWRGNGLCKRCYERVRSQGRRSVVKRINTADRIPKPEKPKPKPVVIATFAYAGVDHYRREWRKRFGSRRSMWWRVG